MRPAPSRPAAAAVTATSQPQRYLTNDEAADYLRLSPRTLEKQRVIGGGPKLRLSPRTLEKQRVIGGGPKFRKFGRRVMYAVSDLDAWADQRSYEATSDPEYAERHAGDYRDGR
ncbi:helix-turn-helix transcriptional regulator [Enterobacter roggenkampii]|uniref:helix-turn-helix transcriptional regulator n=1 Tax=Enterobacter roggenkampii TaxID=1812935 RepID=UPI0021C8ADB6|nr:helix-turn-helix domain-containing protein [Enterobacter roggenkampii]MCU4025471.1 helix-turn-helix domain-containing protein [Enterobacter roggenkampii]